MKFNHIDYDEKIYEESMKLKKLIKDNFKIDSVFESYCMFDPVGNIVGHVTDVITKNGLRIRYLGYWSTKEQVEELERERAEADACSAEGENILNEMIKGTIRFKKKK